MAIRALGRVVSVATMLLSFIAFAAAQSPPRFTVGVGVAASADLPAVSGLAETAFGPGASVLVPVRWYFVPGAAVRLHLEGGAATGSDEVVWLQDVNGTPTGVSSADHAAGYAAGRLLVGPEVALWPAKAVSPYFGAGVGAGLVTNWHSFDGGAEALGVDRASTLQLTSAAGVDLGLRIGRAGGVAVEVEAGYTVSFLPAAPLQQTSSELEASRSPYALDVVRGGLGVSIPL